LLRTAKVNEAPTATSFMANGCGVGVKVGDDVNVGEGVKVGDGVEVRVAVAGADVTLNERVTDCAAAYCRPASSPPFCLAMIVHTPLPGNVIVRSLFTVHTPGVNETKRTRKPESDVASGNHGICLAGIRNRHKRDCLRESNRDVVVPE